VSRNPQKRDAHVTNVWVDTTGVYPIKTPKWESADKVDALAQELCKTCTTSAVNPLIGVHVALHDVRECRRKLVARLKQRDPGIQPLEGMTTSKLADKYIVK